jgi:ABC-2 type transport system ATP-binding protein
VLYGRVDDVRQQYASHAVYVSGEGDWASLPGVERVEHDREEKADLVCLAEGISADDFLRAAAMHPDIHLSRFEVALPSLEDIFIAVVGAPQPDTGTRRKANGA